ncbi:hypothetical protein GOODEAATRI_010710 [Goodea atripinnis]|uniref:Uncharacterized protein n=1 Tax=Goodea atripinnis TaxID=208336 RepID=A0ABV0PWZ3_9TELE
MGQKLERVSERDEESLDNSDWSEQTGDTRLSEAVEQDECRHHEDGSSVFSHQSIGGVRGINIGNSGLAVISSRTDPQSGQPIRAQGQQEHLLNSREGITPQERNNDIAHAKSSPRDSLETEMGGHSTQVTGSRCQLKGVSCVRAAQSKTTGRGMAETDQNIAAPMREEQKKCKDQRQEGNQNHENKFAGAVSKRAKAGVQGNHLLSTKKDNSQAFDKVTSSCPSQPETSHSGQPQLQDSHLFTPEQTNSMPSSSQPGSCNEKMQIACLKKETELVCFSAVVTPPPYTHLLPGKDTTKTSSVNTSSPPEAPSALSTSNNDFMPAVQSKPKGPPPPVPKKPKNPFIKLKTARLISTDVQGRAKHHLRSEDRAKRRHTFDFNKDPLYGTSTNQDMCMLWDEKGTVPTNFRRLSADISPWDHLSLGDMDDRFGDMIDYEYCVRMAGLSPEEEPQDLDMMQRRVFLERRSRRKWSPPPITERPRHTLAKQVITTDSETENPTSTLSEKKGTEPVFLTDRALMQVNANSQSEHPEDLTDPISNRDMGRCSDVGSYKPVAEIVKEKNQLHRLQSRVKPEGPKAQVRLAEQNPTLKVSQMKNTFDVPKKSKERPVEVQTPPKKGLTIELNSAETIYAS